MDGWSDKVVTVFVVKLCIKSRSTRLVGAKFKEEAGGTEKEHWYLLFKQGPQEPEDVDTASSHLIFLRLH